MDLAATLLVGKITYNPLPSDIWAIFGSVVKILCESKKQGCETYHAVGMPIPGLNKVFMHFWLQRML